MAKLCLIVGGRAKEDPPGGEFRKLPPFFLYFPPAIDMLINNVKHALPMILFAFFSRERGIIFSHSVTIRSRTKNISNSKLSLTVLVFVFHDIISQ